jgi:fused signal recognition particle receptor
MAEKSRWSLGAKLKGIFGLGGDNEPQPDLIDDGIKAPPRAVVDEIPSPSRTPEPVVAPKPAKAEKPVAKPAEKPVEKPVAKPAEKPASVPELVAEPAPVAEAAAVEEVVEEKPAPEPEPEAAPVAIAAPAAPAKPAKSSKIAFTDDTWEDLEATLLQADFGPDITDELIVKMRADVAKFNVTDADDFVRLLREALEERLSKFDTTLKLSERPAVVLVVGVNGVGKTTTIGKFAKFVANAGKSVVVGAADTFRAAAVEQVATWAERAGVDIVRPQIEGQDPSAVAYQTVEHAINNGTEIVIIDTAGRLQTKSGLMDELSKIRRVIEKQAPIAEVLLVLDATTGQNGLSQAEAFLEHAGVTGLVLTKLDGSAKGGFVLAVQEKTGIPVKLVGSGEGINDLQGFSPVAFAAQLVS